MKTKPTLYIIIPCYNEEKVLPLTAPLFLNKINTLVAQNKISTNSRIMFVNDGSKDETWNEILNLSKKNAYYVGISQSRNRGHQNAVWAGLMEAKDHCDITISIDCDGQDDINAMDEMLDAFQAGNEVVYGVRNKRKTDSFFKRFTAESFYKLMNRMGTEIVFNHADYRLISSKVLNELSKFKEVNLFLRGIIPLVGFKSTNVYYERAERIAGESHYPLKKMLGLAFDGITSLSVKPIRIITAIGFILLCLGFISLITAIVTFCLNIVESWLLIVSVIVTTSGLTITALGIVGEYIGKIYMETKERPRYIISERTWDIENE